MYRTRVFLTTVTAFCLLGLVPAMAQDVSKSECSARQLEEARMVFHRAWFEEADELLVEAIAEFADGRLTDTEDLLRQYLAFRASDTHNIATNWSGCEAAVGEFLI